MIAYDRYTEYLSKQIYQTITRHLVPSLFQVSSFSFSAFPLLSPYRVAHDLANCPGRLRMESKSEPV